MTISEVLRKWLLEPILKEMTKMAQNMQDLTEAITAVDTKVDDVGTKVSEVAKKLADLSTDFDAAVKKLQDAIDNGTDTGAAITALTTVGGKLSTATDALVTASAALSAIDVKAETISGKQTP